MKKLLLLLMALFPVSVMTQEIYQYTTVPITYEQQNWVNLNQTQQGSNFWDDEVRAIDIGFDFTFYGETFNTLYLSNNGLLSFTAPINGCCSGEPLPTSSFYDYSIFFLWTDLINIGTLNPYINSYGPEGYRRLTIGFYDMPVFFDTTLTSTFEITLNEGTDYVFLNYGNINTGDRIVTAGLQGNSLLDEYTQLYYGNDAGSTLSNTSWLFYSGVYIAPEEPDPETPQEPSTPNCNVNIIEPSCVINSVIDSSGPQLADNTSDPSNNNSREETLVLNEPINNPVEENISSDPTTSEEFYANNLLNSSDSATSSELLAVSDAVMKEMVNEEKASELADSISKDVLELALAVATDAVNNSLSGESATSGSSSSSKIAGENSLVTESISEPTSAGLFSEVSEVVVESQQEAALDILETGRQLGQDALASTLSQTETSTANSLSEAESVAAASVMETESSMSVAAAELGSTVLVAENADVENSEDIQQSLGQLSAEQLHEEFSNEMFVVETQQGEFQTQEEQITVDQNLEAVVVQAEQVQQEETQGVQPEPINTVEYTDMNTESENFLANIPELQSSAEQEELEMSILQQSIASSRSIDDENNRPEFTEAEAMTIASDPALANAFNVHPNTTTLELLGVLGSRNEEKSDAELRAEQVVAANKEQQDAINANYLDADQGGILAAMDTGTNFAQYRNAILRDVAFYKPEDIYKNIVYRDNVRGMYFLEKGSTDTYKQMIEEQYKNE